jgi:dolichyl-phosphate beta-glucosyltransferase
LDLDERKHGGIAGAAGYFIFRQVRFPQKLITVEKPYLSLIIPAYNEGQRLPDSLKKVDDYIAQAPFSLEVIVVDDGSSDDTNSLVQSWTQGKSFAQVAHHGVNMGKGAAVQTGVKLAQGRFILFSDADLSTPLEEVHTLLPFVDPALGGKDVQSGAIASRRLKGAQLLQRQPFYREASGRIFSLLVRVVAVRGFLDTQCGFKLFEHDAAKNIFSKLTIKRFGFDVEVIYIAIRKLGLRLKEVPVIWVDSKNTKVRLVRDSFRMFLDLLWIRINDLFGLYD